MKRLILCTAMLGFLVACSDSSDGDGNKSGSTLVGSWAIDQNKSADGTYKDNNEPMRGYSYLEILDDGSAIGTSLELGQNLDQQKMEPEVAKLGKVAHSHSSQSLLRIDPEYVKSLKSKVSAPSDEQMQKLNQEPCSLKLISDNELENFCPWSDEVVKMVRINAEAKAQMQADAVKAVEFLKTQKSSLKEALAGKKFILKSKVTKSEGQDGQVYESKAGSAEFASASDETGSGEKLTVFAKKVAFSEDFMTALVNGKRTHIVRLAAAKDATSVFLGLAMDTSSRRTFLSASGIIVITADGFELHQDYIKDGHHTLVVSVFEKVN